MTSSNMTTSGIGSAWKIIPGLSSRNIAATVKFYTEELGFDLGGVESNDTGRPYFCSIYTGDRAAANIYIVRHEGDAADFAPGRCHIALGTEGLDDFHAAVVARGNIEVVEAIWDTPWGYRQFAIKDLDGNRLTFFKFLEGGNPGTE